MFFGHTVTNLHQEFIESVQRDFFHGQTDRGLIYWPNHGILTEGEEGSVQLTSSLR